MAIRKSSNSGIPFGNNSGRPANPGTGQPYFNGETQRLELYTGAQYGWQNIVAETPGVTGYSGLVTESQGGTITVTGTNFSAGAILTLVGNDGTEYVATTTTVNNLTSINAVIPAIPGNKEPYDIRVTNPSNLYGVYYDILTVNDNPVWFTAAGSIGTFVSAQSVSVTVNATDDESNTITYSSSNLPAWLTLNSSTGELTGTAPTNPTSQTYSFTISASDAINTLVSRSFSIIVNPVPVVTGGTLTSDSTYYYRVFTSGTSSLSVSNLSLNTDILLIGGGGSGSVFGAGGGGGGAGGVLHASGYQLSAGSYPITVGEGGAGSTTTQNNGQNTTFNTNTFVAFGGGRGGGKGDINGAGSGAAGGSGGGAGRDSVASGGSATQTSGSGYTGYGFSGGSSNSSAYGSASGGGGSGGVGGNGASNGPVDGDGNPGDYPAGAGGIGTNAFSTWISGINSIMSSAWQNATSSGRIAGGGGGGAFQTANNVQAAGGAGGGGLGGVGGDGRGDWNLGVLPGGNGVANTGSGGGGNINQGGSYVVGPGNGGSGLAIIRYTKASVGG